MIGHEAEIFREIDIIAAGGRYDALLKQFRLPFAGSKGLHAVGVNMGRLSYKSII